MKAIPGAEDEIRKFTLNSLACCTSSPRFALAQVEEACTLNAHFLRQGAFLPLFAILDALVIIRQGALFLPGDPPGAHGGKYKASLRSEQMQILAVSMESRMSGYNGARPKLEDHLKFWSCLIRSAAGSAGWRWSWLREPVAAARYKETGFISQCSARLKAGQFSPGPDVRPFLRLQPACLQDSVYFFLNSAPARPDMADGKIVNPEPLPPLDAPLAFGRLTINGRETCRESNDFCLNGNESECFCLGALAKYLHQAMEGPPETVYRRLADFTNTSLQIPEPDRPTSYEVLDKGRFPPAPSELAQPRPILDQKILERKLLIYNGQLPCERPFPFQVALVTPGTEACLRMRRRVSEQKGKGPALLDEARGLSLLFLHDLLKMTRFIKPLNIIFHLMTLDLLIEETAHRDSILKLQGARAVISALETRKRETVFGDAFVSRIGEVGALYRRSASEDRSEKDAFWWAPRPEKTMQKPAVSLCVWTVPEPLADPRRERPLRPGLWSLLEESCPTLTRAAHVTAVLAPEHTDVLVSTDVSGRVKFGGGLTDQDGQTRNYVTAEAIDQIVRAGRLQ